MRKIIKLGRSYAITLPKKFLEKIQWKEGDFIEITSVNDNEITISNVTKRLGIMLVG